MFSRSILALSMWMAILSTAYADVHECASADCAIKDEKAMLQKRKKRKATQVDDVFQSMSKMEEDTANGENGTNNGEMAAILQKKKKRKATQADDVFQSMPKMEEDTANGQNGTNSGEMADTSTKLKWGDLWGRWGYKWKGIIAHGKGLIGIPDTAPDDMGLGQEMSCESEMKRDVERKAGRVFDCWTRCYESYECKKTLVNVEGFTYWRDACIAQECENIGLKYKGLPHSLTHTSKRYHDCGNWHFQGYCVGRYGAYLR